MTIHIYKHNNLWCFTDEGRGLLHEPFVLGMTEIIDHVIEDFELGDATNEYTVIFSAQKFPKYQGHLFYQYAEHNGVWYALSTINNLEISEDSFRGWLCPATLEFFDHFPKQLFFKVEPIVKNSI